MDFFFFDCGSIVMLKNTPYQYVEKFILALDRDKE